VNKLRSILTMLGITIGVFSVIGVRTIVTAPARFDRGPASAFWDEFLPAGKNPTGISGGSNRRKIEMRRNITLAQANAHQQLMEGTRMSFASRYLTTTYRRLQRPQTTPDVNLVGTNEYYLNANQYSIGLGRNLS